MTGHWHQITSLWDNLRVRQAVALYVASFAGIPLSIFTSIVFTRFLGPQGYGDFAFLDSLFDFARIIFPLGFFYAGNRALVLNHDKQKAREYYGATLIILFLLFVLMAVVMMGYGLTDSNLAEKGLDRFFLYLVPFGWVFLLTPYFDNMLHADNRIHELAATRFFPKVVTFAVALVIFFLLQEFQGDRLAIVMSAYIGAFLVVYLLVFVRIRASFGHLRTRLRRIMHYQRDYGIHLYVGTLFSVGSAALTGILISYFSDDNTGVGFFTLSVAIARPLALIPGVIAATWFKDFSQQTHVSVRLTAITLILSVTAFGALLLLTSPFIRFFYSDDFLPVIVLVYLAGVGMFLYGLASFFNRFLEAHGQGKTVRNTFVATGIVLLVFNLLLIPGHGATGAAVAMIIASTVYLAGMIASYWRVIRR